MLLEIWEFVKALMNPESIIQYGGLALLLVVLFLENGAPIGFFLPGDSLLFTAGLLNATGVLHQPVPVVVAAMFIAGAAGYQFGWWTGRKAGEALRKRPDTFWFPRRHLALAEGYYQRYGGKMLLVGRFLPVVRTFAPLLAGMVGMPVGRFTLYNVSGMIIWIGTFYTLGLWAGRSFPWVQDYLGWVVVGLTISAGVPVLLRYREQHRKKIPED